MDAAEKAEFARDMVDLFAERCRGYGTGVDVGHVLRGVLGLIRKHRVRIDANFATLVRNWLCFEWEMNVASTSCLCGLVYEYLYDLTPIDFLSGMLYDTMSRW